jgi:hypothetical protein
MLGLDFILQNIIPIISLSIGIFVILVIFSIYNNKFSNIDNKRNKHVGKVVTVETFNSILGKS